MTNSDQWTDLDRAYSAWLCAAAATLVDRLREAGIADSRVTGRPDFVHKIRRHLQMTLSGEQLTTLPASWHGSRTDRDGQTFKEWAGGRNDSPRPVTPGKAEVGASVKAVVAELVDSHRAPVGVPAGLSNLGFAEVYDRLSVERATRQSSSGRTSGTKNRTRIRDRLTDTAWSVLGVRPSEMAAVDPLDALRLGSGRTAGMLPRYVDRTADALLADSFRQSRHGLSVVVGPPKAGKSRSVYEVSTRTLPHEICWWHQPRPGSFAKLKDLFSETTHTRSVLPTPGLVVLDDAHQNGIGADGLSEAALREFAEHTRLVVILHSEQLARWQSRWNDPSRIDNHGQTSATTHEGCIRLLERSRIDYGSELNTSAEIAACSRLVDDVLALNPELDVEELEPCRIGELLGSADELQKRADHILTEGRTAAAVLEAAIDAKIIGPAGVDLNFIRTLSELHHRRRNPNKSASVLVNQFDEAVEALTESIAPGSPHSLLVRVGDGSQPGGELYRLYDALDQPHPHRDTTHLLRVPELSAEHLSSVAFWHYDNEDRDTARTFWTRAADSEIPEALHWLGILADHDGIPDTALQCYRRAAELGDLDAANDAAIACLQTGHDDEAARWLHFAAEAGHPQAMFNYANTARLNGDVDTARHWFEQADRASNLEATRSLGLLAREAGNDHDAERWFRKAAGAGHALSMVNLAEMVDSAEAKELMTQAIDAGFIGRFRDLLANVHPAELLTATDCVTDNSGEKT
ncbi:hypothetical protein CH252_33410 [Rhodococcus sp. 06-1477-1B]|uniref:tetratricopeptide repeat protein n=1 Tax=Rhodococcus sp. 06-1474-1B TaxID=2022499 RepID=UPI000B9AB077|nr:tetratricopeptide repeat protein [Rhodococcus sp. 06-1474-1B]OZD37386.1 hypothetical protein CH252_33410 [Rhodococcus sp. 06-1477-1B]OZD46274.1 hypothetical protein CH266_21655 [Rhodococcus sp. 06-1474-1B]